MLGKLFAKVKKNKGLIIICLIVFLIYISWPEIYCINKMDNGNVCTYGKKYTSEELLGTNKEYKNCEFRRANVVSYGSTRRYNEKINNHELISIGNRNLVIIDGKLYQYYE